MARYPNIRTDDIEEFEDRLTAYLKTASPESILAAVTAAARFLEDQAESNHRSNMDHVNNATSTLCTAARVLAGRLARAQKAIKEKSN